MVYDALNRRVRQTDPDGHTRYAEFDSQNNQVSAYDARGPLIPDPLGLYTSGNINDRGNALRSAYDGLRRPWQQTSQLTTTGEGGDPLNTTNTYNPDGLITLGTTFDANSRVVSRTDDDGNTQLYAYDVHNRQVAITNADGGWRAWTFDRDDNPTSLRDENNTLHTFTYDGLNRLRAHALSLDATKTNVAGLPLLVGTTLQTFDYDGLSRLVRSFDNNDPAATNDDWTVTQAYDSLERVLEDNQNGRVVNSGYSAEDRTTLYYPNGRVVHQTFDGLNHLVHLANQDTLAVDIDLQGPGPCPSPRQLKCAFSIPVAGLLATDNRSFNNEGLVTGAQQTCSSNTVDSFFFSRNRENEVVAIQRFASLGATFYGEFQTHGYDSAGRETSFTSATNTPSGGGSVTLQTIFDGAQNYRQLLDGQGNVLQIMNVDPVNELQGDSLRYGSSPSTGIRTRDSNFIYQWDGLNRLRVVRQRATPGNIVAVYTYDAQPAIYGGRRVQKTVSNSGALNGTTRFYYDGANAIEETTVNGGNERVARQFIFGTGPDEVFAMDADTNGDGVPDALFFYQRDHNHNTTQLLAVNGSNAVPYELYGYNFRGAPAVFDASTLTNRPFSAAGNPYLFTGQRWDAETGLYYYKARYYDTVYGVFLSDSLKIHSG
jgi:RHS repeat-associated protein